MKKTITLIAAFLMLTVASFAQPGKSTKSTKTVEEYKVENAKDTVKIVGDFRIDTVKVRAYYDVDVPEGQNFVSYFDGYLIIRTFTAEGSTQPSPVNEFYTDKKFIPFKGVVDRRKQHNWK